MTTATTNPAHTRHPLTISYTLMVTDEVINYIKSSDGTRYWAQYWGISDEGDTILTDIDKEVGGDGTDTYTFNTETCLKGIALWIQNGGDWDELKWCNTDHHDHDAIWQYGFFGELIFG
jgi:hypothetical protein